MRTIGFSSLLLGAALLSPAAMAAPTIVLTQGPYSFSDGGEFTALTSDPALGLSGYSSSTATATTFQTFCVQTMVEFTPGTPYTYGTTAGGLSAVGSGQTYQAGFNGSLTVGTAWLYSQFASGHLSGYDYLNASSLRQTDAGLLQAAIWALQGEAMPNGQYVTPTTGNNSFYALALANNGGLAGADTAATIATADNVEILNLSTGSTSAQNQLYYTGGGGGGGNQNVPDNGTTLVLLGLGLCGLVVFGRKTGSVRSAS